MSSSSRWPRLLVGLSLSACLLGAGLTAQGKRLPRYKLDPYTKNDPKEMAKAGYLNYGPFKFGELGDKVIQTTAIEKHLFYAELIWVETAHFRIGSSLKSWAIPNDIKTRRSYREELERLAKKLPRVKPKIRTRVLDPWLRLHLFAQRCEELYTEYQSWLGVTDKDFPKSHEDKAHMKVWMGDGPYLGMRDKYLLLLTDTRSTYVDYLKTYTGRQSAFGQRWHYIKQGSLFYGIGFEMLHDKHDRALHNDVIFNVVINLTDGFRHYSYDLPVWIREAIGHWFERKNNPRWNTFDQDEAAPMDPPSKWRWEPYVRKLLMGKKWSKFSEVIKWRHYGDIDFNDHVMIWARMDFLMRKYGKQKFREFMMTVKGRTDPKTGLPDSNDLVGATRDALRKAYGLNPLTFDIAFAEWVKENYATR